MLNQIRSAAGNFAAKLLLAVLVLAFALWGIGDMARQSATAGSAAKVGSAAISMREFARDYKRESERLRDALGERYTPELAQQLGLPQQVLKQRISSLLLQQEATHLGLVPSDADVVRHIRNQAAFQNEKKEFEKSRLEAFLRNNGLSEQTYVEQLRAQMAGDALLNLMDITLTVPPAALELLFEAAAEERRAMLYTISPSLVKVDAPKPEALEEYYKQQSQRFNLPEYRTVSYAQIVTADIAKKNSVSVDVMKAAYRDRAEEFRRPEQRTVEQLLYATEEPAKQAHALLVAGKSFAEVAKEVPPQNKNATSLGNVTRSTIMPVAEEQVFAAEEGKFTAPIQSPFGWHVFYVKRILPPALVPFEEARPQLEKELSQQAVDEAIQKFTNHFEDLIAGGSTLAEAAKEAGAGLHTLPAFDREGKNEQSQAVKDLPPVQKFTEVVFNTQEGSESSLMRGEDGNFYMLRVEKITPERTRSLDEVRAQVEQDWKKSEQQKQLAKLAEEISTATAFAKEDTRAKAIAQYALKAEPSPALPRAQPAGKQTLPAELLAELFKLKPGAATHAYAQDDHYVIAVMKEVVAAPKPDMQGPKIANLRARLQSNLSDEVVQQYLEALEKKYPVRVNDAAVAAAIQ